MSLKKRIRVLLISFIAIILTHLLCQIVELSWIGIPKNNIPGSKMERKFRRCLLTSFIESEVRLFFMSYSCSDSKEMYIKIDCCCFANYFYCPFGHSCCRRRL